MKILSFGEIVWDVFGDEECLGGAPLNFAAFISILGESSYLVSAVGMDSLGKRAIEECNRIGIHTEHISVIDNKQTGKCIVTMDEKSVPSYHIVDDVAYDYIQIPDIEGDVDVLYFGTLALRNDNNRKTLSEIMKRYSFANIFCDVNIRSPFCSKENILYCLSNATILKISEEELPEIMAVVSNASSEEEFVSVLQKQFTQLKVIIITKGAEGAFCYDCRQNIFYYSNAYPTKVISTVGAGDSFAAAFMVNYLKNIEYHKCLEFASIISAYVCSKQEAVPLDTIEHIKSTQ